MKYIYIFYLLIYILYINFVELNFKLKCTGSESNELKIEQLPHGE